MDRRGFLINSFLAGIGTISGEHSFWNDRQPQTRALPKIDTHVHLYDWQWFRYPAIEEDSSLHKTFLPREFEIAATKSSIQKMVFIESGVPHDLSIKEADWAIAWASDYPKLKAVIAQADMSDSIHFPQDLEVLRDRAMIKGIRIPIQPVLDHPFPFIKNMNLLARSGFSLDLNLNLYQLSEAAYLLKRCAPVPCILNHMGQPNFHDNQFEEWKVGIKHLAEIPHVYCKISGLLPMNAFHQALTEIQPYFDFVLEQFGFDRLLYGGDWPALQQAGNYGDWSKTFDELLKPYSEVEIHKICIGNAEKVYRM